jgi:hypothetical protein
MIPVTVITVFSVHLHRISLNPPRCIVSDVALIHQDHVSFYDNYNEQMLQVLENMTHGVLLVDYHTHQVVA